MRRVGIMGGTFDPVHNGHILLGKQAYGEYLLDEIWYMPSRQPPHKRDHQIADGNDRLNMLRLATQDIPCFSVSDFEMKRKGTTYTAQTMELLRREYPDVKFYFIIGADSLFQLETWYQPEKVMALTSFLVSEREYESHGITMAQQIQRLKDKYHADIQILHNREVDIASAEIRRRVFEGKSIMQDVPELVAEYIESHQLYKS